MELIHHFIDFILHIDVYLTDIISHYGALTYLILFVIIFCETGLVVTPFLPGDSLLFAAGALSANEANGLSVHIFAVILIIAAVGGNMVNYQIGRFIGPAVFNRNYRFLRKDYLDRTHSFYEKYGGRTIIYSRFIPVIRTFAPFVAGVGKMSYRRFAFFNFIGGGLWVVLFLYIGYFANDVGNFIANINYIKTNFPSLSGKDFVKNHFSTIVIAIIIISLLPVAYEAIRASMRKASKN